MPQPITADCDSARELAELLGVETCGAGHLAALTKAQKLAACNQDVAIAALILGATNFSCDPPAPPAPETVVATNQAGEEEDDSADKATDLEGSAADL